MHNRAKGLWEIKMLILKGSHTNSPALSSRAEAAWVIQGGMKLTLGQGLEKQGWGKSLREQKGW